MKEPGLNKPSTHLCHLTFDGHVLGSHLSYALKLAGGELHGDRKGG